jgi:DNA-binding transcriptional ArsR family regulator
VAFSKSKLYPKDEQALSHYTKAMGHPARPSIIMQLAREGKSCVENMTKNHPISQAAMSDHLSILREAQLVNFKEEFPYTYYSLNEKNVKQAEKHMKKFFKKLKVAIRQNRQEGRGH